MILWRKHIRLLFAYASHDGVSFYGMIQEETVMEALKLVTPTEAHQAAAEAFKNEFMEYGEQIINGSALLDQMEYLPWLENMRNNNNPQTVSSDWVVSSTFFAMRESDGAIVGIIDVRHSIKQPFLSQYGGHIGYAVRPGERRKGYAVQMLRQALAFTREIGLEKVMLGCYCDNTASKRTMEACGAKWTETKPYADGKMMDIYWITL